MEESVTTAGEAVNSDTIVDGASYVSRSRRRSLVRSSSISRVVPAQALVRRNVCPDRKSSHTIEATSRPSEIRDLRFEIHHTIMSPAARCSCSDGKTVTSSSSAHLQPQRNSWLQHPPPIPSTSPSICTDHSPPVE